MTQHLDALRVANEVRLARTKLKREIKSGAASVPAILRGDLPSWLEGMPVEDLLRAIPGTGRVRSGQLTTLARVNPIRELQWVTPRQRLILADALETRRYPKDGLPDQ